jgi:MerR family Zn(II)-responsive transcriptional regulator of zntA
MNSKKQCLIGELAKRSGFAVETLRYYDRGGILRPGRRNPETGYRYYDDSALRALAFIRRAKRAGFTLREIRRVLAAYRRGAACCEVVPMLDRKIAGVRTQIEQMKELLGVLTDLRAYARRKPRSAVDLGVICPILERDSDSESPPMA